MASGVKVQPSSSQSFFGGGLVRSAADPALLRQTLLAAAKGESQTSFQRLLFVCFHDPLGGRHTPAVMAGVRIVMAMLLVAAGFFAWRRLR